MSSRIEVENSDVHINIYAVGTWSQGWYIGPLALIKKKN